MPCKHLPKTDLIHRQEMRPLRHGGSHFVNAFLHGDQDDSDVTSCCAVTNHSEKFFVIYRLPDDWYYPWNHDRTYDLSLDFFQQL